MRIEGIRFQYTGSNKPQDKATKGIRTLLSFFIVSPFHLPELDFNRLDGDSVCPPMRSGQDDLPGKWPVLVLMQKHIKMWH